jgi:hypothetical protein
MVHDCHAGDGRDVLPSGVDQMPVFRFWSGQRAIADHAVLGVKDQAFGRVHIVRTQGRHTHP